MTKHEIYLFSRRFLDKNPDNVRELSLFIQQRLRELRVTPDLQKQFQKDLRLARKMAGASYGKIKKTIRWATERKKHREVKKARIAAAEAAKPAPAPRPEPTPSKPVILRKQPPTRSQFHEECLAQVGDAPWNVVTSNHTGGE